MYLRRVNLENIGPINELSIELPFHENGNPKPVIVVGENGTGKSILLSFIVNALIATKQLFFDNTEVEKGKVYKYRSPAYIQSGKDYYFAKLIFEKDIQYVEWQLSKTRREFDNDLVYVQNNQDWAKIPESDSSLLWTNFENKQEDLKEVIDKNCLLYFPTNRFEEPAWLNLLNLNSKAEYSELQQIDTFSNRNIINYAPLKLNQNWLIDILLDREINEKIYQYMMINQNGQPQLINHFIGYQGKCSLMYEAILQLLKIVMQTEGNLRFGVANRLYRRISILRDEQQWIPNIFQLSTGQTLVLNLFLTILRDYDLSNATFESLSEVRGIVIIDEIELHLHSKFQYQVLPELIAQFPKVQFIITSHSPLFILGLKPKLTEYGFSIFEMPNGDEVSSERFSEFGEAYSYFRESSSHEEDIRKAIVDSQKPVLFVEGSYDIRYLRKAAEVLEKQDLLSKFSLENGDGFGNIDKIWNIFKQAPHLAEVVVPQKIILLYDCDTGKKDEVRGNVFKKVIVSQNDTPIKIGIENLFPSETIEKAEAYNSAFIDFMETRKKVRGQEVVEPAKKEVNKDEKGKLCNWLCEVGTKEDFVNFEGIFMYLEEVITENK